MGLTGKGPIGGGLVEPATVAKVEGSGSLWYGTTPRIVAIALQAGTEAPIGFMKNISTKTSTKVTPSSPSDVD
jgi:hypothetical protein